MTSRDIGAIPTALLKSLTQGKEVTVQQVRDDFDINRVQAYSVIERLVNRGFLEWVAQSTLKPTETGIQAGLDGVSFSNGPYGPSGTVPRPRNTFRQRAWLAMRVRRSFTAGDIVADAGRGEEKNDYENVIKYIKQLCRAGIVGELPRREKGTAIGSNGFKRYLLRRDLGRKAPMYRTKLKVMRDHNSGEDLPCDKV
ncbi:MAG: hypothetical protein ABJO27_19230 [Pseudoruegeria sp.]